MTRDLVIQDTCNVYMTSMVTGNIVGVGYAQLSGIEGSEESTDLRGGIGNKLAFILRSSKDVTVSVTSATFKPEFLAMMQGTEMEDFTESVTNSVFLKVTENAGTAQVTLPTDLNALTAVRVEDIDGKQTDLVPTVGVIELTGMKAKAGDTVEVFYLEQITGRGITFDAEKFASKVKLELRTVAYDRELAQITEDLYYIFDEGIPAGAFNMQLQNGEAYIPEMSFRVTAPQGSSKLGRTISVKRA